MKVLSLFSGIGAFEVALNRLGVDYDLVNFCEFDKFATKSYCAIHGVDESLNLGDITQVNEKELPKDIDLLTYGFPCVDISLAGKQKGLFNEDGTKTRSGLFFDALRIIEETQPKVAIAENVKNLTSKKFSEQFQIVLDSLEQAGYNQYWKVLNAKDYGIPQNRERVFIVSIRKDVDDGSFEFPEGFELKLRLKDMLEDEVDEKYYIHTERATTLVQKLIDTNQVKDERACCDSTINDPKVREISNCITSRYNAGIQNQKQIGLCVVEPTRMGGLFDTEKSKHQAGSVWDKDKVSPTIDTMQGGYRQPLVTVEDDVQKMLEGTNYGRNFGSKGKLLDKDGVCSTLVSAMGTGGGNVPVIKVEDMDKDNEIENTNESATIIREEPLEREGWHRNAKEVLSVDGICRTISTQSNNLATKIKEQPSLRIRKLTPLECFKLQGFNNDEFARARQVNSDTQLFKQAGNSICVPVIQYILSNLLPIFDNKGDINSGEN